MELKSSKKGAKDNTKDGGKENKSKDKKPVAGAVAITCHRCGAEGHIAKFCGAKGGADAKDGKSGGARKRKGCKNCGSGEHWTDQCKPKCVTCGGDHWGADHEAATKDKGSKAEENKNSKVLIAPLLLQTKRLRKILPPAPRWKAYAKGQTAVRGQTAAN